MPQSRFLSAALLSVLLIACRPVDAGAQAAGGNVLRFLAGGFSGHVVHEAGHVATGLALGAEPGF